MTLGRKRFVRSDVLSKRWQQRTNFTITSPAKSKWATPRNFTEEPHDSSQNTRLGHCQRLSFPLASEL